MKHDKPKKVNKTSLHEDHENNNKNKKKLIPISGKVNVKSNKFWKDVYDEEGEQIQKYTR